MTRQKARRTRINLYLDIALVVGFILSLRPFLTGLGVHEWLGLAIGAALAVHLVRHWRWVAGVTPRLPGSLPQRTRLHYIIDGVLLVAFLTIVGSGVAMSRVALPSLGIYGSASAALAALHRLLSYATLVLVGAKLVLHRKWIWATLRNLLVSRSRAPFGRRGGVVRAYEQGR